MYGLSAGLGFQLARYPLGGLTERGGRLAVRGEAVALARRVVGRGPAGGGRGRWGGPGGGVGVSPAPPVHRLVGPVEEEGVRRALGLRLGERRRLERLDVQRRVVDLA